MSSKVAHIFYSISLLLIIPLCLSAGYVGQIFSEETGEAVAASIIVRNASGRVVEVDGEHPHVEFLQERWCYVDGQFSLEQSNTEGWTLKIRRGPEVLPLEAELGTGDGVFHLKRWIHLSEQGYMSGDTHVHYLELDQCHLQMRAEDLEVLNLLTSDFTDDVHKFTGKVDAISTPGHWVFVGQEFRDWQQGHINLLRLRKIVEPLEPFGGSFREWSHRHFIVAPAAREAKAQEAAVTWAHFGDIPGTESPIDIALGLIDAVDLISQADPNNTPNKWPPWTMKQPSHLSELPVLSGIGIYYQYLNAGFQIPLASGTDKMSERIPVGSSRLYVKTGNDRSFDAWIEGLKAGNGFISNGPILTFSVDGHGSGDTVEFQGDKRVVVKATARSLYAFSRLQLMLNGEAIASSEMPIRGPQGIFEASLELPVELSESAWLAARVSAPPDEGDRVMPRRMKVFAHANPVYFLRNGDRVRVQAAIDYLTLYLRHSQHWFKTAANFETDQHRAEALAEAERALRIYEAL